MSTLLSLSSGYSLKKKKKSLQILAGLKPHGTHLNYNFLPGHIHSWKFDLQLLSLPQTVHLLIVTALPLQHTTVAGSSVETFEIHSSSLECS